MKKRITTLFLLMLGASGAYAQVGQVEGPGVGIGNTLPAQSAMLDVAAKDKGVLIPRVELSKLSVFGMNGGDTAKAVSNGLVVYNTKVDAAEKLVEGFYYWSADKWNLVVNDKTFRDEITRIERKIGGGTGTGDGGTVIYTPGEPGEPGKPGTPGKIEYIDKDGNAKEIIIKDLIQGAESNTFFRVTKIKIDKPGSTTGEKIDVTRLLYFDEDVVSKFFKDNKGTGLLAKDIPDALGKVIDIEGVISTNFSEIINKTETKTEIEKIISQISGNVTIVNKGDAANPKWEIHIGDGKGGTTVFDINNLETKTKLTRTTKAGTVDATAVTAPTATKDGEIFYTYLGEEQGKEYYVNMTSDVITMIKNNPDIKTEIYKVVNEYVIDPTNPQASSIVMYGSPIANTDINGKKYDKSVHGDVLFKREVAADGSVKDTYINLANEIVRELTKETNTEFRDKIKEIVRVEVEPGKTVETGEVIDKMKVKKTMLTARVVAPTAGVTYNSTFSTALNVAVDTDFTKLKSVYITKGDDASIILTSVTKVGGTGSALTFYFGIGSMYSTLPVGDDYTVVVEYVSKTEAVKKP